LLFVSGEGVSRNVQYAYAPVFSPDGLRVAYLIQQGRKVGVGIDATTLPPTLGDIPLYIAFSPDSRHLVAAMGTAGTTQVTMTVDGQPIERYERLAGAEGDKGSGRSDVVFFDAPDRFHFYAVKDGAVQRINATVPAPADTSPLSISLTPQPDNATISAYEPVVMNYRTVNTSPKTIDLPAWVTEYTLRLEVYNAQGQLLAATPIRDVPADFLHTVERLKPGEGVEQTLVISSFFTFAEPGRYTVRAKQLAPFYPLNDPMHFQGTAEAEVSVLPFDAQRLKARIDRHWSEMRDKGHVYFHPKVLYSVRHNLALPALEWMMREWGDVYAARAIIRIGTPEARQLLKRLQAEPGRVGKAARDIDKLPTGINMWDIVNGTARKITPQNTATQPASPQQPVAGAPYHGLVVSLECAKSYRLGEPVEFKVIEKNVGNQEVRYIYLGFPYNYHLYLTDANGKPVEKTTRTLELEDNEDHPNREREISLSAAINLKPGEEYVRTYDLRQYFKSIPSGSYTLQVRRTARDFIGFTPGTTDRGALSLPCQFTINE